MKPTAKFQIGLTAAALLLLMSCSLFTPKTPTSTPVSGNGTPIVTGNVYSNPESGVSVTLPDDWTTGPGESEGVLTMFYGPSNSVVGMLFTGPFASDSVEAYSAELAQSVLGDLTNQQFERDEAITLADGTDAWVTVATGKRDDGETLKVNMTTAAYGGRAFTLLIFTTPSRFDTYADEISQLTMSLHLEAPVLAGGISRDEALVLLGGESTNPRENDPATMHSSGDKLVFSGLVAFDPQMNLIPDLAETWQVAGGTIYTFTLHSNARFHDGRPVTAQDVVYSWERAAAPATSSDTVLTYLGDIVGVAEMQAGDADHISGLKVIDDHTLQVTIDAPKPYFLLKLTYPTAFVLDKANVESGEDWYRTPNGTGPYRLTEWKPFESKTYQRFDDFYAGAPAIPYVVVQLYQGVGLRLYESGDIDVTGVSIYDVPRMLDPEEPLHTDLISSVNLCTSYHVFDVTQPPFDDPKVRRAFTLAFDRQKYIDVVLQGIGVPAEGIFPPGLPGYTPNLQGWLYDPDEARRLLAESKYGGPEGLPPIVYTDSGYGSDAARGTAALAQMWQQNLGVTITIENLDPNFYLDEITAGHHGQLFSGGWCADYPDPENFADALFHTGAQQNRGLYSNPEVDRLLEAARVEQDVTKRLQLYQQAEQLIVDDAAAIFIVHAISYVLVKPHIQGYILTPVDISLERYLWIDPSKLK